MDAHPLIYSVNPHSDRKINSSTVSIISAKSNRNGSPITKSLCRIKSNCSIKLQQELPINQLLYPKQPILTTIYKNSTPPASKWVYVKKHWIKSSNLVWVTKPQSNDGAMSISLLSNTLGLPLYLVCVFEFKLLGNCKNWWSINSLGGGF